MPKYRRVLIPGGTYFFTVVLANRKSSLLVDNFDLFASAVKRTKNSRPFRTLGWVVLPDHLHTIWTLPKHDSDFTDAGVQLKNHSPEAENPGIGG